MANEDWWGYVKRVIREYPELQRKLESVGETPCVPAYGASGGRAGTISNPVESAVVDRLNAKEQRRYEAVHKALEITAQMRDGKSRLHLIDKVYFKRSHTMYGAALAVATSERTARRWNHEFVRLVGMILDLP